jgi:hypothetical protein
MFRWNDPETAVLVKSLESCRLGFLNKKKALVAAYGIDAEKTADIRIIVFSKYINTINSAIYGHLFLDQDLRDISWWHKVGSKQPAKITVDLGIEQWEVFLRWSLFHATFSIYESFLRILVRAIDPTACSCGTTEFQSIYTTLFQRKLSTPYPHALELSNLMRLIRNMIHNSGLYISTKQRTLTVACNGKTYTFEHMKDPQILTWSTLLQLLNLQASLLHAVSSDPIVKAIHHIQDDYIAALRPHREST